MKIPGSSAWRAVVLMIAGSAALLPLRLSAGNLAGEQQLAGKGNFDGPAELPRVYLKTSLADTPAPGKTRLLKNGGDLQAALDEAACGDTIQLEAAATFTGRFSLPKKACDDQHWIILRTSAPDQALPPEGTRLTPCYGGVASLPGRPDFHCGSTNNVMAKIVFAGRAGSGPIFFADGANHYRFIGIEITRSLPEASIVALVGPEKEAAADHIIFDRVWIHGTEHDETRRGLFLRGATYIGVVDSFFSDFHCDRACTDSQAIGGGGGNIPSGFYKFVNNFLEASGENILFGGGDGTITPTDMEIRHNHLFKPMTWLRGQPGFVGGPAGNAFIVKNSFELKNAQRVLFEGNILENSWGGFSQAGFSVLLTPKNPPENQCPLCRVSDITIRYCKIAHAGGGFVVSNGLAAGYAAAGGERYSIHDVVIDDIDGKKYDGFGLFMLLGSSKLPLKDVKIDHLTAISARVLLNGRVMNDGGKIQNFTFTNNLVGFGEKEITTAGGGPANCFFQPERQGPEGILKNCFEGFNVSNNVIINGYSSWPAHNFFPKNADAVGFAAGNDLGEFRLCHAKDAGCKGPSKYAGAGSDGKDIGADIDLINTATKGVIQPD
jgi:hypothetical protein